MSTRFMKGTLSLAAAVALAAGCGSLSLNRLSGAFGKDNGSSASSESRSGGSGSSDDRSARASSFERTPPPRSTGSAPPPPRERSDVLDPVHEPTSVKDCKARYTKKIFDDCQQYVLALRAGEKGDFDGGILRIENKQALLETEYGARLLSDLRKAEAERRAKEDFAENVMQPPPDQGITSDAHGENVGKIVFAKSEIVFKKENPGRFATRFTLRDDIYARVYMPKSLCHQQIDDLGWLVDKYGGRCPGMLGLYEGDRKVVEYRPNLNLDAEQTWTTFQVVPKPAASDDYDYGEHPVAFLLAVQALGTGTHHLELRLVSENSQKDADGEFFQVRAPEPIAVGAFDLKIDAAGAKRMARAYWDNRTGVRGANHPDKALVRATRAWWSKNHVRKLGKLTFAFFEKREWTLVRHAISGAILHRTIEGRILYRHGGDGLCYQRPVRVQQDYLGNGRYAAHRFFGPGHPEDKGTQVPCF